MSKGVHIGYGLLIAFAFLLTLIALFTPGWRSYKGDSAPDFGIVTYNCGTGNRKVADWDCRKWAAATLPFEKATLGLMCIAAFLEAIAIGCFFALFSPRWRLSTHVVGICALAFICIFVALVIYGARYDKKIAYMTSQSYELLADVRLGYSFYIGIAAAFFLALATAAAGGTMGNQPLREEHIQ